MALRYGSVELLPRYTINTQVHDDMRTFFTAAANKHRSLNETHEQQVTRMLAYATQMIELLLRTTQDSPLWMGQPVDAEHHWLFMACIFKHRGDLNPSVPENPRWQENAAREVHMHIMQHMEELLAAERKKPGFDERMINLAEYSITQDQCLSRLQHLWSTHTGVRMAAQRVYRSSKKAQESRLAAVENENRAISGMLTQFFVARCAEQDAAKETQSDTRNESVVDAAVATAALRSREFAMRESLVLSPNEDHRPPTHAGKKKKKKKNASSSSVGRDQ
jgi:hypothetical protein